ncbi:MAG: ABC transporter ATP-binding protein [Bacteroidales bacterium]|nr:ABC transporter ATP-binding protein [Bacteroidales bacterium]MCF8388664.1 ABC transporter ATP-binding protein [Bacteroidales bacterium]MCF8397979.1 ABC transporter ATP-binding protein [Bacteroidales bacterium]
MLKIKGIHKNFKSFQLKNIHLEIEKGEYFMLLGKSGSGKSLLLEILAGMQFPDAGNIILQGKDITRLDIRKRKIGLLFQDYAIFPHLNVFDNIAYAMRSAKKPGKTIRTKVYNLAEEFGISHLLKRKTQNLSGGEKQRLALARTLAMEPEILLLDEPLTSLDVQLRQGTRKLLRRINQSGQTVIHVTHDHEEAILLADKIAVIHHGSIIQSGKTREVFQKPINEFVANFTGVKNFFRVKFMKDTSGDNFLAVLNENISIKILGEPKQQTGAIVLACRDIFLSREKPDTSAVNNFKGLITEIIPAIRGYEVTLDIGFMLSVLISAESLKKLNIEQGKSIWASFKASSVKVLQ